MTCYNALPNVEMQQQCIPPLFRASWAPVSFAPGLHVRRLKYSFVAHTRQQTVSIFANPYMKLWILIRGWPAPARLRMVPPLSTRTRATRPSITLTDITDDSRVVSQRTCCQSHPNCTVRHCQIWPSIGRCAATAELTVLVADELSRVGCD